MSNDTKSLGPAQHSISHRPLFTSSFLPGRSGLLCNLENLIYRGPSVPNPAFSNCPSHPERHWIGRHSDSSDLPDYHSSARNNSSHGDSPHRVKLPGNPLHRLKLCINAIDQFENCLLSALVWKIADKCVGDVPHICLGAVKQRREANERYMRDSRILFRIRLFHFATVANINCRNPERNACGCERRNRAKPPASGSDSAPVESAQFTRDARNHNLCYKHRNPSLGVDEHSATTAERLEVISCFRRHTVVRGAAHG